MSSRSWEVVAAELNPAATRACSAAAVTAVAFAVYGVAYVVGGFKAIEDNCVAILVTTSFFTGFLASANAFMLAVAVKVKQERWTLLWLPLSVFPALLALLVVGEAFWWEQRAATPIRQPYAGWSRLA